ncbi:MAG: hypothetical protein ACHP6I_01245 [Rickettsiales bacterium]
MSEGNKSIKLINQHEAAHKQDPHFSKHELHMKPSNKTHGHNHKQKDKKAKQ